MRKHRNAARRPAAGLVWLPDVAAYRPNRALLRQAGAVQATITAARATRQEWARAVSFLLTGGS